MLIILPTLTIRKPIKIIRTVIRTMIILIINIGNSINDNINNAEQNKLNTSKINDINDLGPKNDNGKSINKTISEERKTRVRLIIKLMDRVELYDIIEELKKTPVNITLDQLISMSNALCSNIDKSFIKVITKNDMVVGPTEYHNIEDFEIVNNPTHCYTTREVQELDIAIVNDKVNGHFAAILIDSGSNANLVTKNFLNKNIKNYTIVGSTNGRVHQVFSNAKVRVYEMSKLRSSNG